MKSLLVNNTYQLFSNEPLFCYPVLEENVNCLSWTDTFPQYLLCSDVGSHVALINPAYPSIIHDHDVLTSGCTAHSYSTFNSSFVASYTGCQTRVMSYRSFFSEFETMIFKTHVASVNGYTISDELPIIGSCSSDGTVMLIDSRQDNVRASKVSVKPLYQVSVEEKCLVFKSGGKPSGANRFQGGSLLQDPKHTINNVAFGTGMILASGGIGWIRIDKFKDWNA